MRFLDPETVEKRRQRRAPTPVTLAFLEAAAIAYLNRFDATEQRLRQVLLQRAKKACRRLDDSERPSSEQIEEWVAKLMQRYVTSGLLDDRRFADSLCRSLRARGMSRRAVVQRLRSKGVSREHAEEALDRLEDNASEAELDAARRLARKRRLGPYRSSAAQGEQTEQERARDLARLARAGFSFEIARRALQDSR